MNIIGPCDAAGVVAVHDLIVAIRPWICRFYERPGLVDDEALRDRHRLEIVWARRRALFRPVANVLDRFPRVPTTF